MKVLITGATGLIGKKITQKLVSRGDEVIVLTRSVMQAKKIIPNAVAYLDWKTGLIQENISGVDAVINLAGENVMGRRWNDEHKKSVLESRVNSTRSLVEFISRLDKKPKVFISASAIGIYGNDNAEADENFLAADDFLAYVVKSWEAESLKVDEMDIRRVNVRVGIVLDKKEGALAKMVKPFKYFVGGSIGTGKQWFSWIHIEDIVGIFLFALDNNNVSGVVNAAAPNPVTMKDFASTLGKIMNRPSFFSVPGFALKLILGEGAESVLGGIKIDSTKIVNLGYKFLYSEINMALKQITKY
ncbi:MAG: putative nucleoside-diphosphate sugar epimerase [Ignavibacteria bacterium]|nr:MAG: putative nucleoside-diphosphate sugar epimerase [Ignavibacteria bacterium]KAF0157171.1 MAG: putative nucleoside-diphosphate sugar epimerase [Ignavibacteria bacterium]